MASKNLNVKYGKKQRKQIRREGAEDRQLDRNDRTDKEQVKLLNKRLGKGVGAKEERKRLQ